MEGTTTSEPKSSSITVNNFHEHHAFWIWLFLILFIVGLWFFLWYKKQQELATYTQLINTESQSFANPTEAVTLLTDAVSEILNSSASRKMASDYSSNYNISYQQAVLDMAIAQIKQLGIATVAQPENTNIQS